MSTDSENVPSTNLAAKTTTQTATTTRGKPTRDEIRAAIGRKAKGTTATAPAIDPSEIKRKLQGGKTSTPSGSPSSLVDGPERAPPNSPRADGHRGGRTSHDESRRTDRPSSPTARRKGRDKAFGTFPNDDKVLSNEVGQLKDRYVDLASITEEILTYCHLLDNSRSHTLQETLSLRETIRELEKLLDSARQREVSHLAYVEQQRDALVTFERRYASLKVRAKSHIKECQDERDRYRREQESLQQRVKAAESDSYAAQSLVHSQADELDRLREQTKNMPSEREIQAMSLKLRKLEDENGRLATERQSLLAQLDEVAGGKRDERNAGRECGGRGGGGHREARLEQTIHKLQADNRTLTQNLAEAEEQAREYQRYCEVLLEKVPSESE